MERYGWSKESTETFWEKMLGRLLEKDLDSC